MDDGEVRRTLLFVKTNTEADIIGSALFREGFVASSIHDLRDKEVQDEKLRQFRTVEIPIMVASTSTVQVLDVPPVKHVIQFHLPEDIEEYVYRISFTGRNGSSGVSTSIFNKRDMVLAQELVKELRKVLVESNQEVPSWMEA